MLTHVLTLTCCMCDEVRVFKGHSIKSSQRIARERGWIKILSEKNCKCDKCSARLIGGARQVPEWDKEWHGQVAFGGAIGMINSKTMSRVEFLSVEIVLSGEHLKTPIDIGGVYMEKGVREYCQDIVSTERTMKHGNTVVVCELEKDEEELRELFVGCRFDMHMTDLEALSMCSLYYNSDPEPESVTMFIRIDRGPIIEIDVTIE